MKFRFLGEEQSDFMGFRWHKGVVHDVTDEHAVKKLSGSVLFEAVDPQPAEKPADVKPPRKKAKADNGDTLDN